MAERPGGIGPTLYEVAGWLQAGLAAPFRAAVWLLRRDVAPPAIPAWAAIPPRWRWLIVVGLALVAGSTVLFALYLWFHVLLVAVGWAPSADAWGDIRFGLLIVAGVLSAPFVVWRTMIADRQTAINQQTHYTDLYTKAVEMLGADKVEKRDGKERSVPNIEVRLGAIYALQRVMNQSDADYLPILKTLCAYVRENATFQERPSFSEGPPLPEPPEPPEGREETPEELRERLEAISLHAQNLQAWGERLRWKAAARGADSAQRPDIRAALDVLCERPEKRRLALEGIDRVAPPKLDFENWPDGLTPEEVRIRSASVKQYRTLLDKWTGKGVRLDLAAAALQGAARSGADLSRANLSGAQMQGAKLRGARLEGAILRGAYLTGADLNGANLQGANLRETHLQSAIFSSAHLEYADFKRAEMQFVQMNSANMQMTNLSYAQTQGAKFSSARMQGANLEEARMQGVILARASLQGVNAKKTDFTGALLAAADFTDAQNLTFDQLASAFGDAATKLPPAIQEMRQRLITEAGWAEDAIPKNNPQQRWAEWRTRRGF